MTEAAFRRAFVEATGGVCHRLDGLPANAAVAAARAAGVVFAPEAPALPEKIRISAGETRMIDDEGGVWAEIAVAREAVRRYNAWPAIRAAAADLEWCLRQGRGREDFWDRLERALVTLKAALAQEPKP
jgi:hypothetical protein